MTNKQTSIRAVQTFYRTADGDKIVTEWFVYIGSKLVRVCPSIGMAREVAAGAAA